MRTWNRTAVVVVPKQPFLDWLRSGATVYRLPETGSDPQAERRLTEVCREIFEDELNGWYYAPESWPSGRGKRSFSRWFAYSIHSMILDLCDKPLVSEEL